MSAIELRDENESLRRRLSNVRAAADEQARELWTTGVEVGSAFAVEKYIAGGGAVSVLGMNTRRTLALALYLGGTYLGGEAGDMAKAAGRGVACAEAANMGAGRT